MGSKLNILIIDDDSHIANLISSVASKLGCETQCISQPEQLAESLRKYQPKLIFVDLQMPKADGIQMFQMLAEASCRASIVLCSGMGQSVIAASARIAKGYGLNLVSNLEKPFSLDDLERVIENCISLHAGPTTEELREAIYGDQMKVYYQPKLSFHDGLDTSLCGVEALVRWEHPEDGIVLPGRFLSYIEKAGLLPDLTRVVVEQSFQQLADMHSSGYRIGLSVNVPPVMLEDDAFPDWISDQLQKHDIDPLYLTVEITEEAALSEAADTVANLTRFCIKNIRLSLDDFGTGHSSIKNLHTLPFRELKIDRSFVTDSDSSENAKGLVRSLVELGHKLGLSVCAEGVETFKSLQFISSIGCDSFQGFYVSKALPFEELKYFLMTRCPKFG